MKIFMMNTDLLQEKALYDRLLQNCSPQRAQRIRDIRNGQARRNRLAASALLDLALRPCGMREKDAVYTYLEAGKPEISDLPGFHFSISHSGNTAVLAVCDRPVGIDVQRPCVISEALQKRYFKTEELLSADPVRLWTLKESYCKLTGEGIAALGKTELRFSGKPVLLRSGIPQSVVFLETVMENGCFLATCTYEIPSLSMETIKVNRSDLI